MHIATDQRTGTIIPQVTLLLQTTEEDVHYQVVTEKYLDQMNGITVLT